MCSLNKVNISFTISSYMRFWQAACYLTVIVEMMRILALPIDLIYQVKKGICDKSVQKCCIDLAWYMCMASHMDGTLWGSLRHYDDVLLHWIPWSLTLWLTILQRWLHWRLHYAPVVKQSPSVHCGPFLCVFSPLLCSCMDKWFGFLFLTYWIGIHLWFDDDMRMESSALHVFICNIYLLLQL